MGIYDRFAVSRMSLLGVLLKHRSFFGVSVLFQLLLFSFQPSANCCTAKFGEHRALVRRIEAGGARKEKPLPVNREGRSFF